MTDRHSAYLVVLDHDLREDDAKRTLEALEMIYGVQSVDPFIGGDMNRMVAESRVNARWRNALLDLLQKGPADDD